MADEVDPGFYDGEFDFYDSEFDFYSGESGETRDGDDGFDDGNEGRGESQSYRGGSAILPEPEEDPRTADRPGGLPGDTVAADALPAY